jgi:hypothetical protein
MGAFAPTPWVGCRQIGLGILFLEVSTGRARLSLLGWELKRDARVPGEIFY